MELTLDIEEETYGSLGRRANRNGFDSTDEYASMIIRTVIDELEGGEEDDAVRDRLEDLGYL